MAPSTRFVSLLAVLLLAATACTGDGGAAADPKAALRAALRSLAEGPGLTITASLDTDVASLRAASADAPEPVPEAVLQMLTDAALRVSVPLGEEPVQTGAVVFAVADDDLVELRAFEEDVYVRADVRSLLAAAGQDPAMVDGFAAMLSGAGLPADALDGRWLKLAGGTALAEQLAGQPSEPAEASVEAMRARVERLATILADASTVEHAGEDANGEHLRASVPLREVYDAVMANAADLGLPQEMAGELPSRTDVPDISVVIDAWVRDGRLTAAAVDLLQFAALRPDDPMPPGVERLGLHLAFAEFDGEVEVPADAVELDAEQLLGGFFAGMGGMMPGMPMMPGGMPPGGMAPGGMPMTGPDSEVSFGGDMAIDPVLVAFYGLPAYAGARLRYCRQISDMPAAVRARHYADICPGLDA